MTVDEVRKRLEGCDGSDQLYLFDEEGALVCCHAVVAKELSGALEYDEMAMPPGIVFMTEKACRDIHPDDVCVYCSKPDAAMQYTITSDEVLWPVCTRCHELKVEEKRCPDAALF